MSEPIERVSYVFKADDGPDATFEVHRMQLVEQVDAPFELLLELVTTDLDTATDELLGAACSLEIIRADRMRPVYGIIDRVDYLGYTEDQLMVNVRVVPAFALLAQQVNSRIFQDMSVLDIVKAVVEPELGVYGRTFDPGSSSRGTEPRDYCVQYRESNLDFVARLLEEEGISWHFVHDEGKAHEVLSLTFENTEYQDIANVDGSATVPIVRTGADTYDREALGGLDYRRLSTSTATMHMDFDWKQPSAPLFSEAAGQDERSRTRRVYRHDLRRFIADDGVDRATEHKGGLTLAGKLGHGTGNVITFQPCTTFEVERHDRADLEVKWAITRVEHRGVCPDVLLGMADNRVSSAPRYVNTFSCVPVAAPVRPVRQRPKPRAYGPETATVVGPAGEEIHVDEHGRIKVQFHWEEEPKKDDTSSCWIRVRQNWAGAGWGFQFIPRIGMEVVVEFLAGNPDRPMVNGCVYNGENAYPYAMPGDKTKSGIKTNSVSGEGSNEIRFEDAGGSEELWMHAQKDMNSVVENNQTLSVGADRSMSIGANLTDAITKNKTITVGGNHKEDITGNMDLSVTKNQTITVTQNVTEQIMGKRDQKIAKTSKVMVVLAADEIVGLKKSVKVGGLYSEQVGASRSITAVGAMSFTAGLSGKFQCAKNITVKARKNLALEGDVDIAMKSGKKMTLTAGDDFGLKGAKKGMIDMTDSLTLKCGDAMLIMKKDGTITLKGKDITIKGSGKINVKATGELTLKGSKIAEN
ncbi:MAG: type VI secretion system tip protein VgrG [Deltaproteobacteria bacterium]|nr:type VI secretion system tip protein VgrG [Nannocystaceae bacterium]